MFVIRNVIWVVVLNHEMWCKHYQILFLWHPPSAPALSKCQISKKQTFQCYLPLIFSKNNSTSYFKEGTVITWFIYQMFHSNYHCYKSSLRILHLKIHEVVAYGSQQNQKLFRCAHVTATGLEIGGFNFFYYQITQVFILSIKILFSP